MRSKSFLILPLKALMHQAKCDVQIEKKSNRYCKTCTPFLSRDSMLMNIEHIHRETNAMISSYYKCSVSRNTIPDEMIE